MAIGVLAIQGDFDKHAEAIKRAAPEAVVVQVRTVEDLEKVDRLILPGGESTTVGLLLARFGLGDEIVRRASEGMPIWGTCMGLILMASEIENHDQYSLNLLDVTVRRNAFGAQVHSFEDEVEVSVFSGAVTAVFIRAPIVTRVGAAAEVIATYDGEIVGVKENNLVGTSFHPELTDDVRFHSWFLDWNP